MYMLADAFRLQNTNIKKNHDQWLFILISRSINLILFRKYLFLGVSTKIKQYRKLLHGYIKML